MLLGFFACISVHFVISILVFSEVTGVVRTLDSPASFHGRPHDTVNDMLVIAQNLDNRVIIIHLAARSSLRAFLPDLFAVPNDDTLVFARRSEEPARVAHGNATDPVRVPMRQRQKAEPRHRVPESNRLVAGAR